MRADADASPGLVQTIGRWSLTALVINSIIGSGIFGLPSVVASRLGTASPLAYLLAAIVIGIIMGCLAEVASQFSGAGGPYLYTSVAFGRFLGLETGWLMWLSRLAASAAACDLFITYFTTFWPHAQQPGARAIIAGLLVGILGVTNVIGVKAGTRTSDVFTIMKLLPLVLFTLGGLLFLCIYGTATPLLHPIARAGDWFEAALVLVFAYGGFEAAMVPMSEARDPRRDAPFALGVGLLVVTLLYVLIQIVTVGVLADPSATDRPLALAAGIFAGNAGAATIAVSALVCLYGYLSAQMLHTPRLTFAFAERGDFPRFFGAIHRRFHTPYVSIVVFALLLWTLAIAGNFQWNVLLSAVARLFTYGLVCGALLVLRRRNPETPAYRLPGGRILAWLGIVFMAVLVSRMHRGEFVVILITAGIALANWMWVRTSTKGLPFVT
jgi:APA family basic amino acid/polyamine antiporter